MLENPVRLSYKPQASQRPVGILQSNSIFQIEHNNKSQAKMLVLLFYKYILYEKRLSVTINLTSFA